jgi:hypothetical protein
VLARHLRQLALGRAPHDHEVPAALLQGGAQLAQRLEHELRPAARGVAPVQQRVVEHEHRDDALAGVERRPQRRVVVHAQVAPEPDKRGRAHRSEVRDRA